MTAGFAGTALGENQAGSENNDGSIQKGKSTLIDLKVTHEYGDKVPITEVDRLSYPTYYHGGSLHFVNVDITEYVPDAPMIRTPFGLEQAPESFYKVHMGKVVEADFAGTYAKLLAVDDYAVGDATVEMTRPAPTVTIEGKSFTIRPGKTSEVTLESRTIEVPQYSKKTVSVSREGYESEKEIRVPTGTRAVEIVPTISATNRGISPILGKRDSKVFPTTMPGANMIWNHTAEESRTKKDGLAVTKKGGKQ